MKMVLKKIGLFGKRKETSTKIAAAKPASEARIPNQNLAKMQESAVALTSAKKWVQAAQAWAEVRSHYTEDGKLPVRVVEQYSKSLRNSGRPHDAYEQTSSYMSANNRHPSVVREHAENAAAIGDIDTAVSAWNEFIKEKKDGTPASAFSHLAKLYADNGMLDAALDAIDRGFALHPKSDPLVKVERQVRTTYDMPMRPMGSYSDDYVSHLFENYRTKFGKGTVAATFRDEPVNAYVKQMLDFKTYYAPVRSTDPLEWCDAFFVWGSTSAAMHDLCREYASRFDKPLLTIEYGFVSSLDIAVNGAPQHSIIVCPGPIYYDSTQETAQERLLNSEEEFDEEQIYRARRCIEKLVSTKVTKYNHAPILDISQKVGRSDRPKILLIDQRRGDKSVSLGLASAATFRRMFEYALSLEGYDILVKLHPDAISGKHGSYLGELAEEFASDRVVLIDYDVNPFSLFDVVEKVFVATSQVGLEAVFAGREVYCFGVPFYAGWGITNDMVATPRRRKIRSLEEVFATYYFKFSRYYVPGGRVHELEELIDFIAQHRKTSEVVHPNRAISAKNILMVVPSGRMGASGRYMQNLAEGLIRLGSKVLILSEGKTVSTVNGVNWATIEFDGALLSKRLRAEITRFSPDVVYMNGVRTRAQRVSLEAVALTGATLVNQSEDDDLDVFIDKYPDGDVGHLASLDKPVISIDEFVKFIGLNNWEHTLKVLADPGYDRWIEPILRMLTNRLASAHTAIWSPFANRLAGEYGKPTLVVPPVAGRFDFDRQPATAVERDRILARHGIDSERVVFFVGGSIYRYSNEFQVFLRALNILSQSVDQPIALVVAGRSSLPVDRILEETLRPTIQLKHLVAPPDPVFIELMRASDICCNPGLENGFNEYRLPSRLVKPMAMGKAVLTCRIGFGASLKHGVNAIVTEGNDPAAWAKQMETALSGEKRAVIGMGAKRFAIEHFDPDKTAGKLLSFFSDVMSNGRGNRLAPLGIEFKDIVQPDEPSEESSMLSGLQALSKSGQLTFDAVAHVGAGQCSEIFDYVRFGAQKIVLAEADPERVRSLFSLADGAGNIEIIDAAVSAQDLDSVTLWNVKNRDGEILPKAASIRRPESGMLERSALTLADQRDVQTMPIAEILDKLAPYENALLVIEAQGVELALLKDAALGTRSYIDAVVVRSALPGLYEGGAAADQVLEFLVGAGFDGSIVAERGDDTFSFVIGRRNSQIAGNVIMATDRLAG